MCAPPIDLLLMNPVLGGYSASNGHVDPSDPLLPTPDRAGSLPGRLGAAQLTAVEVLSVAVRWGPVVTVMNGTLVARPVRAILVQLGGAGSTVTAE
jgi:hypothetical protein